jgi:hypothetical protein
MKTTTKKKIHFAIFMFVSLSIFYKFLYSDSSISRVMIHAMIVAIVTTAYLHFSKSFEKDAEIDENK